MPYLKVDTQYTRLELHLLFYFKQNPICAQKPKTSVRPISYGNFNKLTSDSKHLLSTHV